jgi:hypothetical protein
MMVRFSVLLAFLAIAACGSVVRPDASPRAAVQRVTVLVEPVDGTSIPMGKLLAGSVAEELSGAGVPAAMSALGASPFVLRGRAETNSDDPNIPFINVIHWTLFDDRAAIRGTYDQGIEGSRQQWQYGDPVVIRSVGKGAATPIMAMIREDATLVTQPEPLRTALMVKPVLGAPSNGNQMLSRAIGAAVESAGYATTDDPQQAGYVLQGLVDVDPAEDGRKKVRITWTVTTGDGKEVGRAAQENTLPTESLEGPWDRVAVTVVAAAFPAIDQMLDGAKKVRADEFPSAMGKEPPAGSGPPVPSLPQIPGRAPPPPAR